MEKLFKTKSCGRSVGEERLDLEYFRRMSVSARFRLMIERSLLLMKLAGLDEKYRKTPALIKRR